MWCNLATALPQCAPPCENSRRSRASASPSACAMGTRSARPAPTAASSRGSTRRDCSSRARALRTWRRVTASTPTCRASRRLLAPRRTRGCPRRRAPGWSASRLTAPRARPPAVRPPAARRSRAASRRTSPAGRGARGGPRTRSGCPRPSVACAHALGAAAACRAREAVRGAASGAARGAA